VRAYLRAIRRGEALLGPAFLLLLSVAIIWAGYKPESHEATGQEKAREALAPTVAEPATPLFPEFTLPDLPKHKPKAEARPTGIPGLSNMDVIGYMQYLQGTDFRCPGGGPAGGGSYQAGLHVVLRRGLYDIKGHAR